MKLKLHALGSGDTEIVKEKQNVYSNDQELGSENDSESIIQSDCMVIDKLDVVQGGLDDSTGEDLEEEDSQDMAGVQERARLVV